MPKMQELPLGSGTIAEGGDGQVKITTVSAHYGLKVNLSDFQAADVSLTLWENLDEADSPADCMRALFDTARTEVREEVWPLIGHIPVRVQQLFGGRPVVNSHSQAGHG